MRAGGARNHEIVWRVRSGITVRMRGFAAQLGALLLPAQLHHFRQSMYHHIEKTADHQPQYATHDGERERR